MLFFLGGPCFDLLLAGGNISKMTEELGARCLAKFFRCDPKFDTEELKARMSTWARTIEIRVTASGGKWALVPLVATK